METMEEDVRLSLRMPREHWEDLRRRVEEARRKGLRRRVTVSSLILTAVAQMLNKD